MIKSIDLATANYLQNEGQFIFAEKIGFFLFNFACLLDRGRRDFVKQKITTNKYANTKETLLEQTQN